MQSVDIQTSEYTIQSKYQNIKSNCFTKTTEYFVCLLQFCIVLFCSYVLFRGPKSKRMLKKKKKFTTHVRSLMLIIYISTTT